MKCKHCGFEIKDNEKFCMNCGTAVVKTENESATEGDIETVDSDIKTKMLRKNWILAVLFIAAAVFLVIVIAVNSKSPERNYNTINPADIEYTECSDVEITFPPQSEESTTEKINEYKKIGNEILQYPSTNDIFTYDVYETYVEITGSVEKDLTGELVIPETLDNLPVRSISSNAFGGPGEAFTISGYSITSLILSDNLYKISEDAFYRCVNLSSISFGKNIQFIGSAAFAHTAIKSVDIPDSVIEMGASVFLECKSLKSVKLGKMMTEIPESMFNSCYSLNEIEWVGNIVSIGQSAFRNTAFSNIDIPKTITTIERWVFADMPNLIEFIFPDSVTEISDYVFEDCESLEKVTIGNGINRLPAYLFQDCANLSTLIIPGNVGEIDTRIIDVGLGGQSNPTIYGEAGTAAARFASSKGLTFKLLET